MFYIFSKALTFALIFQLTILVGCEREQANGNAVSKIEEKTSLADGIDFSLSSYPAFIAEVTGLSGNEKWGRWTDANLSSSAKFKFKQPLPQNFTLELKARVYGPNMNQPVVVKVGSAEKIFSAATAGDEVYKFSFQLTESTDTIEIIPPKPTAPSDINANSKDTRKLALGLVNLKVIN